MDLASFQTLSSGKVRALVRRKGHKTATKSFTTKKAARAWARRVEAEMELSLVTGPANRSTVEEVLHRYEREVSSRKRSKTDKFIIQNIVASMGSLVFDEVSANDIVEYVDERLDDVTTDTVLRELGMFGNSFKVAMALWGHSRGKTR